jgi:hypothetical protein
MSTILRDEAAVFYSSGHEPRVRVEEDDNGARFHVTLHNGNEYQVEWQSPFSWVIYDMPGRQYALMDTGSGSGAQPAISFRTAYAAIGVLLAADTPPADSRDEGESASR